MKEKGYYITKYLIISKWLIAECFLYFEACDLILFCSVLVLEQCYLSVSIWVRF